MKGVDEIIGLDSLKDKLERSNENKEPLIVKLGLDPSAPDIHLGHTVVLRKMKQLQDLGHKVVIIIGDFIGKIGDPTDQRFNVLMGRMLQKEYGQEPQATIFMPLLEGLDGKEKMSKSLGNYIGIDEKAEVMYEKAMTIPDELIIKYFNLVTDIHPDDIEQFKCDIENKRINPRDIKIKLAKEIVTLYHGENEAQKAEERFKIVFQKGKIPSDIDAIIVSREDFDFAEILVSNNIVKSKNEVIRLVCQGGVKVNGNKIDDLVDVKLENKMIIQIGKKRFIRIDSYNDI